MSNPILSKAPASGQWRMRRCVPIALECLALLFLSAPPVLAEKPSPPGLTAPRYAALKVAPVNARGGPGEDYKALWTFQAKGVPLQIVEESGDWKRVCDPEGGLGWVRARALDGRHRVIRTTASDLPMRQGPSMEAKVTAILAAHAIADLSICKAGWCRINVDHAVGWVHAGDVWGTSDAPQCK